MHTMNLSKEIENASKFEQEFNRRKAKISNPSAITRETVELVNFAVKYDRDRYLKQLKRFFISNRELLEEMAYTLEGVAELYDKILASDDISKWYDNSMLMTEWRQFFVPKMEWALSNNKRKALQFYGKQLATVGLMKRCLWYDLSISPLYIHSKMQEVKEENQYLEETEGKALAKRIKITPWGLDKYLFK